MSLWQTFIVNWQHTLVEGCTAIPELHQIKNEEINNKLGANSAICYICDNIFESYHFLRFSVRRCKIFFKTTSTIFFLHNLYITSSVTRDKRGVNPLDGCTYVYLDMGTNIGVQIRYNHNQYFISGWNQGKVSILFLFFLRQLKLKLFSTRLSIRPIYHHRKDLWLNLII